MDKPLSLQRLGALTIFGAWSLYLALVGVRLAVLNLPNAMAVGERHVFTALTGALLTGVQYAALSRLRTRSTALRIAAVLLLSAPAALALAVVNYNVMFVFEPDELWSSYQQAHNNLLNVAAQTVVENYFLFVALGALYTSVSNAIESREADQRAARAEAEARQAQLQALRYQLDPHFLFNALNTISSLVMEDDTGRAEQAITALSEVLRTTLAPDALADTTLRQEFELQRSYLELAQIRYGDRLNISLDLPHALEEALIPALLVQPLVENVIRHAVSVSEQPVRLRLTASEHHGELCITVEDDGPGSAEPGLGVGLRNVSDRLQLRFASRARCEYGPAPTGGFRAVLHLPLELGAL